MRCGLTIHEFGTCKPDFDQVQGMKHQRWHHSSTETCHQVFDPHVAEDLPDVSSQRHGRDGFAGGQSRLSDGDGSVIWRGVHAYR